MKRSVICAAALVLLGASPALTHRIDEYLQASTLLVSAGRLQLEVRLAPGIEIAEKVLDSIDLDHNGVLSNAEQRVYALRLLHDLDVTLDGRPVNLSLTSLRFDRMAALRDGTGEVQLVFAANLPSGGEVRRLVFENRHRPEISAYLVNSLVPEDPAIRIAKQERNYQQSIYQLEYIQTTAAVESTAGVSMFWLLAIIGFIVAAADEVRRRTRRNRTAT
jgi:hypothetical protein